MEANELGTLTDYNILQLKDSENQAKFNIACATPVTQIFAGTSITPTNQFMAINPIIPASSVLQTQI